MKDTHCQDCGRVFSAPNSATRYCNVHRLNRNLRRFGLSTTTCTTYGCNNRFCQAAAKDLFCWKHTPNDVPGLSRYHVTDDCKICGDKQVRCYSAEARICLKCLRDPKRRKEVLGRVQALADRLAGS